MELAKITSEGQITIPRNVREKLDLKAGDQVLFFEENDRFFLQNSNSIVLSNFQKAMEGAAQEAGFNDPDEVTEYIKELRKANKN